MVRADEAFLKWYENSKGVVNLIDAWLAGVNWGNEHPNPQNTTKKSYKIDPNKTGWLKIDGNVTTMVAHFDDGHRETMSPVEYLTSVDKRKHIIQIDFYSIPPPSSSSSSTQRH